MNEETKPTKLHFINPMHTIQFSGVCNKLGIGFTVTKEEDLTDEVTTQPLTNTEKRKLIAAWSAASIERL